MSATNKTAIYELPIFLGTDVPSWLTDWNGAMGIIDNAIAAAKAAADAAASTAGTAAADIVTIQGNITSLQGTVGTHTTQIGTISGAINTINSLIGNGTPTTTDQTIIGAINELHADQGDLDDLDTTDKNSLVAAVNEVHKDIIKPHYDSVVTTITTAGASYTCPCDGYLIGTIVGASNGYGTVRDASQSSYYLAMNTDATGDHPTGVCIPFKTGDVIRTGSTGTYNLAFTGVNE